MLIDEGKPKDNDNKAHLRKPSNGVQGKNKIINPVKQLERMATSGSLTLNKDSYNRKLINASFVLKNYKNVRSTVKILVCSLR